MKPRRIFFAVHLKHSSFCPSAVVEPMSIDQVHAIPLQCMQYPYSACLLSLYVYYDLYDFVIGISY